ncbi:hypothetical protein C8R45DRAFT_170195 [Mycena sanguinolenta]|nr:hypothetical protein C8R45DRAFT_170195 [Mycena sanguinolenta]
MHSPFQAILHTNAVPTDAECDRIRDFLRGPHKELEDLTNEIIRLRYLLGEATCRRDELEEFTSDHFVLASPVRRLPDDIVREIFLATLPLSGNPSLSSREPPRLMPDLQSLAKRRSHHAPSVGVDAHHRSSSEARAMCEAGHYLA